MKRSLMRPVAVGIATFSTLGAMVVGAVSSQAASVGTLTYSTTAGTITSGTDATIFNVITSAACPVGDGNDTNVIATISSTTQTGASAFAGAVNIVGNSPQSNYSQTPAGGLILPLAKTLQQFAATQPTPVTLSGIYSLQVSCIPAFGAPYGTFDSQINFNNTGQAAGAIPWSSVVVVVPQTTATALAATPSSPVNTGVPVTFTVHVTPTPATPVAAGTVQLLDGATPIGAATALDGTGSASIAVPFTTAGSHSITAAFTGATANVGNSVSTAVVYTVNQAPADATTTSLVITPASATTADTVKLTATVADTPTPTSTPGGTVQFADGGTALGAPVLLSGGVAVLNNTYAVGGHSFTATYIPSSATTWVASASAAQAYTVTTFAGSSTSENILTTIASGSLVISVAQNTSVVLPNPTLNAAATFLTTSGPIHQVTVTDTRAGNPGWTASGQVSDFTNTSGPTTTPINGYNLGWAPTVTSHSTGQTIVPGGTVAAAAPPVVADPTGAVAYGLKTARTLASAVAGAGTGTALLDANLTLNVPTTTLAGTYSAVLTLTAM